MLIFSQQFNIIMYKILVFLCHHVLLLKEWMDKLRTSIITNFHITNTIHNNHLPNIYTYIIPYTEIQYVCQQYMEASVPEYQGYLNNQFLIYQICHVIENKISYLSVFPYFMSLKTHYITFLSFVIYSLRQHKQRKMKCQTYVYYLCI